MVLQECTVGYTPIYLAENPDYSAFIPLKNMNQR